MLSAPMRMMKAQYFLSFGVLGAWVPIISVWFREQSLTLSQIGSIYAAAGVALALTPVLMTLIADTKVDPRHLLSLLLVLGGVTFLGVWAVGSKGYAAILAAWGLHNISYAAVLPLQDGINFAVHERRKERGEKTEPYHRVRIWGTFGYIVPSAILYALLKLGYPVSAFFPIGAACAFASAAAALFLPAPGVGARYSQCSKLPTGQALGAMMRPPVRVFCVAMLMASMASTVFHTYYPVYLKERVGLPEHWVGPISASGSIIEIPFVIGFGWLAANLGYRRMMLVGAGAMVLRFVLLFAVPTPPVAIGTQLLHGLMVMVIVMAPPVFLNRHAGEGFRNSMQGVYALIVVGTGRVLGNYLAGTIASRFTVTGVFAWSAILCALALALIWVAFYEEEHPAREMSPAPIDDSAGTAVARPTPSA